MAKEKNMANKGQMIMISLENVRKKRKNNLMKEKPETPEPPENQGRILTFKSEELGDEFIETGNGKILKLNVYGRVIGRGDKSGTMTIDAINIAKDENSKDSGSGVIPRPSA
jgi:hypothetical protein